jgi:hypothetical protein
MSVGATVLCGLEQSGLEKMTPDISKLVNLQSLCIGLDDELEHIPESISCLQQLTQLEIDGFGIGQLPAGLAMLPKLATFHLGFCGDKWRLPPNLQVKPYGTLCEWRLPPNGQVGYGHSFTVPGFCTIVRQSTRTVAFLYDSVL